MKVTPPDTGSKMNLHNSFIWHSRCQINVLSTFFLIIIQLANLVNIKMHVANDLQHDLTNNWTRSKFHKSLRTCGT